MESWLLINLIGYSIVFTRMQHIACIDISLSHKKSNFGNDTFTEVRFKNWNNAKNAFKEHTQTNDGALS